MCDHPGRENKRMYLTTDLLNKQIPKREGIEIIEIIEIIKRSVTANEGPMFDPQPSMLTTREVQQELRVVYLKKKAWLIGHVHSEYFLVLHFCRTHSCHKIDISPAPNLRLPS